MIDDWDRGRRPIGDHTVLLDLHAAAGYPFEPAGVFCTTSPLKRVEFEGVFNID